MTQAVQFVDRPAAAAAILNPLRQKLLEALSSPDSATGLAKRLGMPRQHANYHLRALEEAGFITQAATRRRRNCTERILQRTATSYILAPAALGSLGAPDPVGMRDRFSWTYLVSCLARAMNELTTLRRRADAVEKQLPTFTLDAEVRFASPEALHAFAEELSNDIARLVRKHADTAAADGRSFRFLLCAHPTVTKSEQDAAAEAAAHETRKTKENRT